jgi:hypothetical protein
VPASFAYRASITTAEIISSFDGGLEIEAKNAADREQPASLMNFVETAAANQTK